jgi:hypothetical protein
MLKEANSFCLRLWKDESGVVLALTVVVFLMLFVMACSVYAVGETIRQRIEVQNAADAAAYSGAVVQADTISRVAVINRAMAWTYVQMGRMEMDYIIDKWLERAVMLWKIDNRMVKAFARASTCSTGPFTGPDDWWTGCYGGYVMREHILLNKWQCVEAAEIERETRKVDSNRLAREIDEYRRNIEDMNRTEVDLIEDMPKQIEEAVVSVLKQNVIGDYNDALAGDADFMFVLLQKEQALDNFDPLRLDEEDLFLIYADYFGGAFEAFGPGTDDWWHLGYYDPPVHPRQGGLQRYYRQTGRTLIAEWKWHGGLWQLVGDPPVCVLVSQINGQNMVRGIDVWETPYFTTERCEPWKLKPDFFARGGAIVVGLSRRMNNPFYFIFRTAGESGIFKAFTVDDGNHFMWGVAAAIASFNPRWPGDSNGEYDPTYWDGGIEDQNLRNTDWDATLLPLHRAWADGKARSWSGETAGEILATVRGGPWEALYGGGGALGSQGAPRGLNEGAEAAWGALEGWTVH